MRDNDIGYPKGLCRRGQERLASVGLARVQAASDQVDSDRQHLQFEQAMHYRH